MNRRPPTLATILVADEDDQLRSSYSRALADYLVYHAVTGLQAESILNSDLMTSLDVVVLDFNLGRGPNGAELYKTFRDTLFRFEIGVILATAQDQHPEVKTFLNDGRMVVPKPFKKDDLLKAVVLSNRHRRLQPERRQLYG